ncbi:hypothetical protein GCM10017767_30520 [Halomonas urumqiensis]|nr:hypothetical protein GCM10017767_30520 [Halomonas urumqiensis]
MLSGNLAKACELALFNDKPRVIDTGRLTDRLGVAIDCQQAALGGKAREDSAGMPPTAECTIEVGTARLVNEGIDSAVKEHTGMSIAARGCVGCGCRHAILD